MNQLRCAALMLLAAATSWSAVDPALLNLVMPDATVLSGIQVDQSQASPFGQYVLSQMQAKDDGFQKLIAATGFDPRRDLHEILAAATGDPPTSQNHALVLGRGAFRPATLSATATAAGVKVTQYRGFDLLTGRGSSSSIAFLDTSTAVLGNSDLVKAAIDRYLAGSAYSGPLAQKVSAVSASNQAWFVTLTPLSEFLNRRLGVNPNNVTQSNLLQQVLQASGGVNFGASAVTLSADAVTSSDQNAQALVDVMKFLFGLVQTKTGSLANAATFTANGAVMHVTMSVPEQQIEQLFGPRGRR